MAAKAGRREAFFGQQVVRLMAKTCLANDLGHTAFTLLAIVSAQQDAARGRPVTYWNEQLMAIAAIKDERTLRRVRQACIDAGWLIYEYRGPRKAGVYQVAIPGRLLDVPDTRCDEGSPEVLGALDVPNTPVLGGSDARPAGASIAPDHAPNDVPDHAPPPSSPYPYIEPPTPLELEARQLGDFQGHSLGFTMAWLCWPPTRRSKKLAASAAWNAGVARLAFQFEGSAAKAEEWLLSRVKAYAKSPRASGRFCKGIANWLIDGNYDDDDAAWQDAGDDAAPAVATAPRPRDTKPPPARVPKADIFGMRTEAPHA